MNRHQLFAYILNHFGITPDYPWKTAPDYAVFRHAHNNKWFALVMRIPASKLGLNSQQYIDVINIKARPEMAGILRQLDGVYPAYHMNKQHWLTIVLDKTHSDDDIVNLVTDSFDLTQ